MQIKTTRRYHYIVIRMVNIWDTDTRCWWGYGATGTLTCCWWEWKMERWTVVNPDCEYYSALKRNELSSFEETWRKLKCILLSERSQSEKATYCKIPIIWHSEKGKMTEIVKKSVVAGSQIRGVRMGERWTGRAQRYWRAPKIVWWIHVTIICPKP